MPLSSLGEAHAVARILVLDVLDDDLAAGRLGTRDHFGEGRPDPFDQITAIVRIEIEIVVVPGRERRMDHHLRRTEKLCGLQPLEQTLGHRLPDHGIVAVDLEAPERPVDAEPTGMAREHLLDVAGGRAPVAIEEIGAEEILDLEIALPFQKPVAMRGAPNTGFDMACSFDRQQ
ncbi:hypothetical protein ACVME8_006702 [Bradyrhizobium diazoefficiens]